MKTQSIDHTAFPDGSVQTYIFGMPKPEVVNLSEPMKQKAKELADKLRNQSNRQPRTYRGKML